jgi:hypothetical protein
MDQKQSNSISKVIGLVFMFFGFCILCIGVPLLIAQNKESFELSLAVLLLAGGGLMLVGGYQTIRNAKEKDTAVNDYKASVKEQLRKIQNLQAISNSSVVSSEINSSNNYTPDIIVIWHYSKDEWRLMTKEETTRRLKEGIWVSLLIGVFGSWALHSKRGVDYITGLIISLCVGGFISILKVLISNAIFRIRKNNSIIITTNALIINGKFKTINDKDINLESLKSLKIKENNFIEFSLQWLNRRGVTNDQLRIFVPIQYKSDINKVLEYYESKGVKIENT